MWAGIYEESGKFVVYAIIGVVCQAGCQSDDVGAGQGLRG